MQLWWEGVCIPSMSQSVPFDRSLRAIAASTDASAQVDAAVRSWRTERAGRFATSRGCRCQVVGSCIKKHATSSTASVLHALAFNSGLRRGAGISWHLIICSCWLHLVSFCFMDTGGSAPCEPSKKSTSSLAVYEQVHIRSWNGTRLSGQKAA